MTTWILDPNFQERMRDRGCGGPSLAQAARALGHHVVLPEGLVAALDTTDVRAIDASEQVIVHGTIPFVQALEAHRRAPWFAQARETDDHAFDVAAQARFLSPSRPPARPPHSSLLSQGKLLSRQLSSRTTTSCLCGLGHPCHPLTPVCRRCLETARCITTMPSTSKAPRVGRRER